MNAHPSGGLRKQAGLMSILESAGSAAKSIFSQGTSAAGMAKTVGRSAAGALGNQIPRAAVSSAKTVGSRMLTRGLVGAGIGAGGSMLRDKAEGKDVSVGRALGGAAIGGGVGAALGTTMGKRIGRSILSPGKTPSMSLGQAANPMRWGKGEATQIASRVGTRAPITAGGRSAFGNMSVLDKAMTLQSGYEGAKALTSDEYQGHRAEGVFSAVGQGAAMMTGARWAGMRKGTGSTMGHLGRTIGLYLSAGMGGSMLGRAIDKRLPGNVPTGGAYA